MKELFNPTKKKLIVFIFIILTSAYQLQGYIQRDIVTNDVAWPQWKNTLMYVYGLTNPFGGFFNAPNEFLIKLLPKIPDSSWRILSVIGLFINAYILASLIGRIWEIKKTQNEKYLLKLYIGLWVLFNIGIFAAYFSRPIANFVLVLTVGAIAGFIIYKIHKGLTEIFLPLVLLTIIFMFGALGMGFGNFEENYCWGKSANSDLQNTNGFNIHMQCHEDFDLFKAVSETNWK